MPKTIATSATASTPMFATRTFRDAGTGRSFDKGAEVNVGEGELVNYAAAGLVAATNTEATAADAA